MHDGARTPTDWPTACFEIELRLDALQTRVQRLDRTIIELLAILHAVAVRLEQLERSPQRD